MNMANLLFVSALDLGQKPQNDHLLPFLAQAGWEISVVAPGASESILASTLGHYAAHTRDVPVGSGSKIWAGAVVAEELMRARAGVYDVIYVQSQQLTALASVALAGPLGKLRLVFHNTEIYDPLRYPWRSRAEVHFTRKADLYINTEFHRAYAARLQSRSNARVIVVPPNLPQEWPIPQADPLKRHEITGSSENTFVLMHHGGVSVARRTDQLFEALSRLPERFRLAMTGGQPTDSARQRIATLGLSRRVCFLPALPFNEMLEYTVCADAGVLLYENTDFGNFFTSPGRLSEYAACGLPIVGTAHTGLEVLINRFKLGRVVDSTDPVRIAHGLLTLEEDIRLGRFTRSGVRTSFARNLSVDLWAESVISAFASLVGKKGHRVANPPPAPWWLGSGPDD